MKCGNSAGAVVTNLILMSIHLYRHLLNNAVQVLDVPEQLSHSLISLLNISPILLYRQTVNNAGIFSGKQVLFGRNFTEKYFCNFAQK